MVGSRAHGLGHSNNSNHWWGSGRGTNAFTVKVLSPPERACCSGNSHLHQGVDLEGSSLLPCTSRETGTSSCYALCSETYRC